ASVKTAPPQKPILDLASADNKNPRNINSSTNGLPINAPAAFIKGFDTVIDRMLPIVLCRKIHSNLTQIQTEKTSRASVTYVRALPFKGVRDKTARRSPFPNPAANQTRAPATTCWSKPIVGEAGCDQILGWPVSPLMSR